MKLQIDNVWVQDKSFSTTINGKQLFGLMFVSILAVMFSFGLALPWVVTRGARTILGTISFSGDIDFKSITPIYDTEANALAEGLGEAGDAIGNIGEMLGG